MSIDINVNELINKVLKRFIERINKEKQFYNERSLFNYLLGKNGRLKLIGHIGLSLIFFYVGAKLVSGEIIIPEKYANFNVVYGILSVSFAWFILGMKFYKRGKLYDDIIDIELRLNFLEKELGENND